MNLVEDELEGIESNPVIEGIGIAIIIVCAFGFTILLAMTL
jgi:hypothetical protein